MPGFNSNVYSFKSVEKEQIFTISPRFGLTYHEKDDKDDEVNKR